jgi:hypothetical protein
MVGAVFLHCPAKPLRCLLVRIGLSPDGNPLDGCGQELSFVELDCLGADLAFVVVIPSLGLDVHAVSLSELLCVLAKIAEDDDVLPVGAGLPVSCVVGSVGRDGNRESNGRGGGGLFGIGSEVAQKGGTVQVVDHGVLLCC